MKIIVNQVPAEGLYLEEEINPAELDLETDLIKPRSDLKIKAQVYRITNALTVELNIRAFLYADCSRCLEEFGWEFNKDVQLSFPLDTDTTFIDLNPSIREEVILDYPIKPLCKITCKGLCVKCGKNKNEGGCNCAIT
ncbi:MAG: YceD family protein [Candidatus Omnitrophica bacterium]|nr:YceD family protein [Candidatus Omnitrophota bacterium]